MFSLQLQSDSLSLLANGSAVLKDITLRIGIAMRGHLRYRPISLREEGSVCTVDFERVDEGTFWRETAPCRLLFTKTESGVLISADIRIDGKEIGNGQRACMYTFDGESPLFLDYIPVAKDAVTFDIKNPFWASPVFGLDPQKRDRRADSQLLKCDGAELCLLPVPNDKAAVYIGREGCFARIGCSGKTELCCPLLAIGAGGDAWEATDAAFDTARQTGVLTVPFAEERPLSDMFRGFGWCTWNACYHDVTSALIYEKLEELKAKNIPLRWLLIDDGWSVYREEGDVLLSLKEDRTKFPEGLKECIRRCKEEYGVKYVGVWHAFTGYWNGIAADGAVAKECADYIYKTPAGFILPGPTRERAEGFFSAWYEYLSSQGVDFVKVDNQAGFARKFDGVMPIGEGMQAVLSALENAANRFFGGKIIHCMGATLECSFHRTLAVNRNSDDYFPDRDGSFVTHSMQNGYYALIHRKLHVLDFDMFWSTHPTARESMALRAISGGPIYVSDRVGETDAELLRPLIGKDAALPAWDGNATVTRDLVYVHPAETCTPLKLWNKRGNMLAVAAFGLSKDRRAVGVLRLSDIPCAEGEYSVKECYSGEEYFLDAEGEIPVSLSYGDVAFFVLTPR